MRFDFELWAQEMVREVIRREFDVRLSAVSVGRLLRKMGLSPQRPTCLATQQYPGAAEQWKTEMFPQIRAEAAAAGGTVWFADEAGVRSDYQGVLNGLCEVDEPRVGEAGRRGHRTWQATSNETTAARV